MDNSLVADLRKYRDRQVHELEQKMRQDAELHAEIADLKRGLDHATQLLRLETGESIEDIQGETAPVPLRPLIAGYSGGAVADVAREVLIEANRPLHYRELTEALQARGVVIGGKDPANNVIAAMTRDERFYRPRRGTYFLRELAKGPVKHVGVRHRRGA